VPDGLARLLEPRPYLAILRDVLDIAVVAYVVYRVLRALRGTRGFQVAVATLLLLAGLVVARQFELVAVNTVFSAVLPNAVLIAAVIFQQEIRQGLARFGRVSSPGTRSASVEGIEAVIRAVTELARHRTGAIVVIEQDADLRPFKVEGTSLDAVLSSDLLVAIFVPERENPLHDGAAVIRNWRIDRAGALLPLSTISEMTHGLGTRHRAALGITEETDALVVVVSEERGTISVAFNGSIVENLDEDRLREMLYPLLGLPAHVPPPPVEARAEPTERPRPSERPHITMEGGPERTSRTPTPSRGVPRFLAVSPPDSLGPDEHDRASLSKVQVGSKLVASDDDARKAPTRPHLLEVGEVLPLHLASAEQDALYDGPVGPGVPMPAAHLPDGDEP
jgi:diadenylate cyclase